MSSIIQVSRHVVIPPIMQMRVMQPRTAAIPWYLSGGIPAANCLAAYTPKGAASLAASYDNNAAPGNGLPDGTYDCTLGVAPTWAALTGWSFNGTTQNLITGTTPAANWSLIARFSGAFVDAADRCLAGLVDTAAPISRFYIQNTAFASPMRVYGYGDNAVGAGGATASGIMALTSAGGYLNGLLDIAGDWTTWVNTTRTIYIGAQNRNGSASRWFGGDIQALAIYNTTISAPQVLAVSTAMASL